MSIPGQGSWGPQVSRPQASAYGTGRSSAVGTTSAYGVGRAPTTSAVGAGFDSQPPTAVRHLTTAQLQTVLRGRGVRLPEGGAQSHAYYVELCRSQGLLEVTAAELTGCLLYTSPSPRD